MMSESTRQEVFDDIRNFIKGHETLEVCGRTNSQGVRVTIFYSIAEQSYSVKTRDVALGTTKFESDSYSTLAEALDKFEEFYKFPRRKA